MYMNGNKVDEKTYKEHSDNMRELNDLLRKHDWFYSFSDDHSVWVRGETERKAIQEKVESIGVDAEALAKAYQVVQFGPHSGFSYSPETLAGMGFLMQVPEVELINTAEDQ